MAATMLPPGSGGSFLDSPSFNHTRSKPSPTGFGRLSPNPPRTTLRFDISDLEDNSQTSCRLSSKLNTPDSGFFGAASSTPLKTPESDISSTAVTPPSGGSGSGHRKRKTVTIDESQTSIVVINPDDLFNTYSKLQVQSQDHEEVEGSGDFEFDQAPGFPVTLDDPQVRYVVDPCTGWPLRRSDSLESRDNPFLPGGDLSREAEDLLSRATIIRDHFYLNEDEKRTLREHQQLQQQQEQQDKHQRNAKHVQIMEHTDDVVKGSGTKGRPPSSPPHPEAVEERISAQSQANNLASAAPASSLNGGDNHQLRTTRENGKVKDATTSSDKLAIPDGDNQPQSPGQTDHTVDVPAQVSGTAEVQQGHDSDKKRRNKCCSIM